MKFRLAVCAALIVLLATIVVPLWAIAFDEVKSEDIPGGASRMGDLPKLTAGPYLSKMTPNAVTMMWQTDDPAQGRVLVYDGKSTAEYSTVTATRLSELRIKGLKADTKYSYRLWITNSRRLTGSQFSGSFHTFPDKPRKINFIVYGDTRTYPERHRKVIDEMASENDIDFVLHTGDLVGDGRKLDLWKPGFFDPAAKLLSKYPFYPVLGNHDGSTYYFQLLSLPGNEKWYSFDDSNIHVIALDSLVSFDVGSDQYNWLISDLEKNKSAKWKFIVMHSPVYTSGPHGGLSSDGLPKEAGIRTAQKLFPSLAKKYGIRAVFSGHDHAYERSVRDGVDYIVTGGGGAENYSASNAKNNHYRKVFYSGLHYCVVSINGNKAHMTVKTPEGKILDQVDI